MKKKLGSYKKNLMNCFKGNRVEECHTKHMYSQFGEDVLLDHLFNQINNGKYLDIGCFHPFKFSNTAELYRRGWSGVNIDASPESSSCLIDFGQET